MARLPRLSLAAYPHHVVQRGNNGQAIFLSDQDRLQMLALLEAHAPLCEVAVHAYVLMDNHVHLLLTPRTADGLSHLMQAIGRRYVRYFNDRHGRTGTLWEGRYKSTLIEAQSSLLACMAYIDLNPVRAGWVTQARDYPWSSHAHHAGLRVDRLVTPHSLYWGLGNTPFAREAAYTRLVQEGLPLSQQQALTESVLKGWVFGSPAFVAELQKKTARRLSKSQAGRPVSKPSVA